MFVFYDFIQLVFTPYLSILSHFKSILQASNECYGELGDVGDVGEDGIQLLICCQFQLLDLFSEDLGYHVQVSQVGLLRENQVFDHLVIRLGTTASPSTCCNK